MKSSKFLNEKWIVLKQQLTWKDENAISQKENNRNDVCHFLGKGWDYNGWYRQTKLIFSRQSLKGGKFDHFKTFYSEKLFLTSMLVFKPFYIESYIFQNSHKSHKLLGLL